jgi:hypothetical protein
MQGKLLRQVLDKMMTSGYAQNARVQVLLVLDACLKVPKLYEGSCIRDLVARGLKLEPKESGFKDIEKFLSNLGA